MQYKKDMEKKEYIRPDLATLLVNTSEMMKIELGSDEGKPTGPGTESAPVRPAQMR